MSKLAIRALAYMAGVLMLFGMAGFCAAQSYTQGASRAESMKRESPAFEEGNNIPAKYTCKGDNISPPLSWSHAPAETVTFALIVYDPDAPAGTWDHWLVYNIPSNINKLENN